MKRLPLLLVLAATSLPAQLPQQPAQQAIVLHAAKLIDPKSGRTITNATVVVENGRITAVGSELATPANAHVIQLGNVTLLPGLIDSHTHLLQNYSGKLGGDDPNMLMTVATMSPASRALLGAKMGREDLDAGITSVRDVGNSGVNGDVALRDAIRKKWVSGPRIIAATRALSAAGGQFGPLQSAAQSLVEQEYVVISTPDEARRAVRQAFYDGADVIKVIVNTGPRVVSLEEMRAIVDEANRVGRHVAAHAIGDTATMIAAQAGVTSIEHAYTVPDTVLKVMAAKHIFLVPTDFPADFYVDALGAPATPAEREASLVGARRFEKSSAERLMRAIRFGVPIAFGSDQYYDVRGKTRGESSLMPLVAYQNAGMAPMEILRAATINAATLLGIDAQVGSLEQGKVADIIAVEGDPLKNMADLQRTQFVMKGGEIVRQPSPR